MSQDSVPKTTVHISPAVLQGLSIGGLISLIHTVENRAECSMVEEALVKREAWLEEKIHRLLCWASSGKATADTDQNEELLEAGKGDKPQGGREPPAPGEIHHLESAVFALERKASDMKRMVAVLLKLDEEQTARWHGLALRVATLERTLINKRRRVGDGPSLSSHAHNHPETAAVDDDGSVGK